MVVQSIPAKASYTSCTSCMMGLAISVIEGISGTGVSLTDEWVYTLPTTLIRNPLNYTDEP